MALTLVAAACGGVETEQPATSAPTPTPSGSPTGTATASPTPTGTAEPTPTATATPSAVLAKVFFSEIYVFDDSEPGLTEPGECVFAFDVNGLYQETSFDCNDQQGYDPGLPLFQVTVPAGGSLTIAGIGIEDDPTDDDDLGEFTVSFGADLGYGAGAHTVLGMFGASDPGHFQVDFDVAIEPASPQ